MWSTMPGIVRQPKAVTSLRFRRRYRRFARPESSSRERPWQRRTLPEPLSFLRQAKPKLIGNIALTFQYLTQHATQFATTQSCGSFHGSSIPHAVFGYGLLIILKSVEAP